MSAKMTIFLWFALAISIALISTYHEMLSGVGVVVYLAALIIILKRAYNEKK